MSVQRITQILEGATFNTTVNEFDFHDGATATGNGLDLPLAGKNKVFVFLTGLCTSRTVTFKGIDNDGNLYNVVGLKLGDLTFPLAISTTGINEVWLFDDIQGFKYLRMVITAIGGTAPNNTLSIKGVYA
jgi:hypothetical protein